MNLNDMKQITHQQTPFISCWQGPEWPTIYTIHNIKVFPGSEISFGAPCAANEQNQSTIYTKNLDSCVRWLLVGPLWAAGLYLAFLEKILTSSCQNIHKCVHKYKSS